MEQEFARAPKELISDSLQDILSDEELIKAHQDLFVSVVLETPTRENSLMGNLVGIELCETVKIDLKVSIEEAFRFITESFSSPDQKYLLRVVLALQDSVKILKGPFKIINTKIIELDPTNKVCVLAVDLLNEV